MVVRVASSIAAGAFLLSASGVVFAEPLPRVTPVVFCMPSEDQTESDAAEPVQSLCLVRLEPWFEGTSFEVLPRIKVARRSSKSRWGAQFELHF